MKTLSHWASRHIWQSRIILILLGIIQGAIFVNIGFAVLKDLPIGFNKILICLSLLSFLIISFIYKKKIKDIQTVERYYQFRNRCVGGIYFCMMTLMMLWGNTIYNMPESIDNQYFSIRNSAIEQSTTPSVEKQTTNEFKVKKASFAQRLMLNWKAKMMKRAADGGYSKGGLIALFFLGIGTFLLAIPITCGLICANLGVLAVILALSGITALILGIYFLILGVKPDATLAQRTPDQHKKDRRWAKVLAVLAGIMVVTMLVAIFSEK
jgi:hypothetical protein